MGHLVVLTQDLSIQFYPLEQIASAIETSYGEHNPVVRLMFLRNDWLSGETMAYIARNAVIQAEIIHAFDKFPQPFAVLDTDLRPIAEYGLHVSASVFLDFFLYGGRCYFATDAGIFHLDVDWHVVPSLTRGSPEKRSDATCYTISAKYGALMASCGSDGLYGYIDEFGSSSDFNLANGRRLAEKSMKIAWADTSFINYTSNATMDVLRATLSSVSPAGRRPESEKKVMTRIEQDDIDLTGIVTRDIARRGFELDEVQFAFNSNSNLFLRVYSGEVFVFTIERVNNMLTLRRSRQMFAMPSRILSMHFGANWSVLETTDSVLLFADRDLTTIVERGVLSVRTYPRSRRYRSLVSIVHEEGVQVAGVFDESAITVNP